LGVSTIGGIKYQRLVKSRYGFVLQKKKLIKKKKIKLSNPEPQILALSNLKTQNPKFPSPEF
jgi:hypothetical protein